MPPATLACNRCDAPIQIADLDQGLAVRVDGELVCQQCVDNLPGEAQVKINQLRAMRGLSATTYAVNLAAHPALHLFTFTTAGNITVHRRALRSDGAFSAPTLPVVSEPPAPALAPAPPAPAAAAPAAAAPAARSGRPLATAALARARCIGGGAAVVLHHGGSPAGAANAPPGAPQAPAPVKTRFDYAVDPLQGWIQARDDRDCPELVRQAIALELERRRSQQLDEAELALKDGRSGDAVRLASALSLPDDISFRELRAREDELRRRIADSRALALLKPDPAGAPRPAPASAPGAPARSATALAAAAPPAATPANEAGAPNRECLKFPGKDLVIDDSGQWKRVHNDLQLGADAATVRRAILVDGGSYQVWMQLLNRSRDSTLQAVIGGVRAKPLEVKSGNRSLWMQLQSDGKPAFALPGGSCMLAFDASGRGLEIVQVMVYDSALPAPDQAERLHPRLPRWGAAPPSEAVIANATLPWKPRFIQAAKESPVHAMPLDGSVYLPPAWPGGIQGFWKSVRVAARKRQAMTLDFHDSASDKGGIALLLHPGRLDRKQLLVTVYDLAGRTVVLPPFQFDGSGDWQVFAIQAKGDLEGAQIGSVLLEDDNGADFPPEDGFILGKGATCIHEEAGAAALALPPPALLRDEHRQKNELKLLEAISRFRRHAMAKAIDPARLRLLVGASLGAEWRAAARSQLDALLPGRLPVALTQELVLQDSWLDALTKGQGTGLEAKDQHIVMVATAGAELKAGMTPGQAVDGFWKKRLEQLISNGYLPVAVLGPSLVETERRGDADKLWSELEDFIAKQLPGVPMIDLRGAAVGPLGEFTADGQDYAAAMLADGYGEFIYWLRRSGGAK